MVLSYKHTVCNALPSLELLNLVLEITMHARTPSVFLAMAYLACRTVSKWDVSILMGCGPGNELDDPHKVLRLSLTSSAS